MAAFYELGWGWLEMGPWGSPCPPATGYLSHGTGSELEGFPDAHGREFNPKQRTEPFWKEKPEEKNNNNKKIGSQEEKYLALNWSTSCSRGTAHRREWITVWSSFL